MDQVVVAQPQASAGAATLAAQETLLADREEHRAKEQRHEGEASTSRWARRLHEKRAEIHDQSAMGHRDAAERFAIEAGVECRAPAERPLTSPASSDT